MDPAILQTENWIQNWTSHQNSTLSMNSKNNSFRGAKYLKIIFIIRIYQSSVNVGNILCFRMSSIHAFCFFFESVGHTRLF